jgi:16S rRNA (uracil1498-N3)-methyltransferase
VHKQTKIRLFVDFVIDTERAFDLDEGQSHYLFNVMKLEHDDRIYCLDNKTGEYLCEIVSINKKSCNVRALEKVREFEQSPDIWMLFSPIKKDNTDMIIQKSTELGARRIVPTISLRSISEKVRIDRYSAQSIEAAEQCRRLDLPQIAAPATLTKLLQDWGSSRILFFMDESGNGEDIQKVFSNPEYKNKPAAILVGPEGGFSEDEFKLLRRQSFTKAVTMGSRILRAETAAISALACWQAMLGDWNNDR